MTADLEIAFHGLDPSPAVEAAIRRHAEELERFTDRLIGCRVVLEAVGQRHRKGSLYGVRIDLMVPDGPVVVNRQPGQHHAYEDVSVALHDAFDDARRALQDHMRRLDGKVKRHEAPSIGRPVW